MSIILSIVIPTRNRFLYAKSAIKSVLSISSKSIELVVQDSSDKNELGTWIALNIKDKRIKYNYSPPPLSMTENFNKAVSGSAGEYVCIIGDDDGVNPEIVEAAYWAKDNSLDALAPELGGANYCWPDFRSRQFGESHAGKLFTNKFTETVTFSDVELEMQKCVRSAGQNKFGLPKVYFGLVKRSCLLKVNEVTGSYFMGVSPDVFGALAIANYGERVCVIDYPLVLPGNSGRSNSGRSALGQHKGSLSEDPHMVGYDISKWPECVPKFFSVQTVWAGAAVESLIAIGRNDLLEQFNWKLLHAQCIVYHSDYLSATAHSYMYFIRYYKQGYFVAVSGLVVSIALVMFKRLARYIYRLVLPHRGIREKAFSKVNDIEHAIYLLTDSLKENGKSFNDIVSRK